MAVCVIDSHHIHRVWHRMAVVGVALGTPPVDEALLPAAVSVGTYQRETKILKCIET